MQSARVVAYWALLVTLPAAVAAGQDGASVAFNRQIRPILSNNCFLCHGPDKNHREGGLRLDVREEATAVRDGVAAIVPGDVNASELIRRITSTDPDIQMPPPDSGRSLTDGQIALLTTWVQEGAVYQPHWSYIPPERAPLPALQHVSWPINDVDRYVLADMEAAGLEPSPAADRVTLIRRLHADLIGLPPTPEEVDAFVNDTDPEAYAHLVDRLLASEHFGERLAIYWLDLVRYADTVGYHGDQVRGASAYRDYVINAFNANMPFDEFTREQLGGDLLPDPSLEQLIASGYNRLNMVTREGGAQDADYVARYAADRVRTTATAWLGSSMACCQCHDHKFDPFSIKDFYSFGAFFADIDEKGVQSDGGNEAPFPPYVELPTADQRRELDRIASALGKLDVPDSTSPDEVKKAKESLLAEQAAVEAKVETSVITASTTPRTMRVLPRGNWMDDSGEIVTPAVPAFLGAVKTDKARPDRLDLAAWITSRENPLTARVFVNRLWKMYFGTGISKVLDDVGSQGEWPKHPELLDYLAVEFMDSGWDIKHIVREMVTSAAYRQTSMATPEMKEIDPFNRMIARQSRFRLNAELIRDNALAVSGLLVPTMGGRSVMPYQPARYYAELNFPERVYQADTGDNLYRRSVYTHWQRTFLNPSLLAFDAPTREECTAERTISNSPLQALTLLNDVTFVEASRVFAERIIRECSGSTDERIAWAYRHAFSREPMTEEVAVVRALYDKHFGEFTADEEAAKAYIAVGEKPVAADVAPAELAAWSSVSRTLFNLHEMIYRY